jgi:hypothetical protein
VSETTGLNHISRHFSAPSKPGSEESAVSRLSAIRPDSKRDFSRAKEHVRNAKNFAILERMGENLQIYHNLTSYLSSDDLTAKMISVRLYVYIYKIS